MRRVRLALALVIALATALRFARLHWGLDENLWFADETVWLLRLRPFDRLRWSSFDTTQLGYPTLYPNVGGLGSWMLGLVGVSTQGANGIGWMRLVAATASIVAVLATIRVGMAMYGPWVGAAAGALLAVAPLEVMQVHYASVEPLLVLGTVVTIGTSVVLMRHGTAAAAALAGVAVGLTAAAKYPGVAFASAVVWAIMERWWRDRSVAAALRLAAVATIAFVATFALACPSCILHTDVLVTLLDRHRQMAAFAGFAGACLVPTLGWWHRPWIYEVVASLPYGLGLPLAVLGLVGVAAALYHRAQTDRLLLATVVPYFAYMGASGVIYPRYMLPLFPPLALLGAAALGRMARRRLATIVVVLVVAYGTALSVSQLARFSWDQQAAIAAWLADRMPAVAPEDRRVGIPTPLGSDPYFNLRTPIVATGYQVITHADTTWLKDDPGFFVMPEWLSMTIRRDRRNPFLLAKLGQIESGRSRYRPVLRIPSPPYLQRPWDEAWDPTFAMEIWQGAMGFTVYARDDVLPELTTVEVLDPLPPRSAPVARPPGPG